MRYVVLFSAISLALAFDFIYLVAYLLYCADDEIIFILHSGVFFQALGAQGRDVGCRSAQGIALKVIVKPARKEGCCRGGVDRHTPAIIVGECHPLLRYCGVLSPEVLWVADNNLLHLGLLDRS